ncbi:hypothetical protein OsI_12935 [Oryza sativa Indica Group]|jgi:hypothetical protein|uniref:Uncharacterized protein n=1 Tax=Oryza sativa subsp. indica TaxID=39946 RepID=B8AP30_ORYSI|nr:hypothetical protein OsI_12935 [Oryza sativa Indica Group]
MPLVAEPTFGEIDGYDEPTVTRRVDSSPVVATAAENTKAEEEGRRAGAGAVGEEPGEDQLQEGDEVVSAQEATLLPVDD